MFKPISLSEAAGEIQSGRLSPVDLVERCLARIRECDDRIRAWVVVDEAGARQAAQRLAEELDRGAYRGPLHGIPLGVKDIVDVAGFPTRAGSPITSAEPVRHDAPLVAALRQSGAIVLGKTVTCQLAGFDPSPTRNPWDLARTPGGSSSGSAAAVAAGMCLGAIGTQTGGSLVRPASYCGVAALKPSFGLIPSEGVFPLSHHLDHPGAIARSAADLERLLEAMVGPAGAETPAPAMPPRLGLLEEYFLEQADEAVRRCTQSAVQKLAHAGAHIDRAALPTSFADVHRMHRTIMAVEAAAVHRRWFGEHRATYAPAFAGLLEEGLALAGVDYAEALAHQRTFRRQMAAILGPQTPCDALVMPATSTTAPASLATTGDPKLQVPWSYAGLPVVSIPSGLAGDGLPAAIQLAARAGDDFRLFRIAQWCQQRLGFHGNTPLDLSKCRGDKGVGR